MDYIEFKKKSNLTNDDLINTVLAYNNITDLSLLNNSFYPYFYKDYLKFIEAIDNNERIAVIGDYDCDGICATSIMMMFLKKLNKEATFIIGNRIKDGYGMNDNLINSAKAFNASLIITVDNGINCKKAVEYAKSLNIDVVVTDHHLPSSDLPNCPIFNPHLEDLSFKNVCGAFVSLTLILNYFNHKKIVDKDFMNNIYELAALATISDVMPLYDINRKIVSKLINDIKNNNIYNKGISLLLTELNITNISSSNIAYYLVPVINAAGRIDDASIVVEYFIENQSNDIIKEIIRLNEERKSLTTEGLEKVRLETTSVNVCLLEDVHEGILGIISSRLVDKTNKPSIVFTSSNGIIKGSGRSISGFDLYTSIVETNANYCSFGGHTEAVGIAFDNLEDFMHFKKEIQKSYIPTVTNYYIKYNYSSFEDTFKVLEALEPTGEGLKIPLFYINGKITNVRHLTNKHTSFQININGKQESFIFFNALLEEGVYELLFSINKEIYRGNISYKGFVKTML